MKLNIDFNKVFTKRNLVIALIILVLGYGYSEWNNYTAEQTAKLELIQQEAEAKIAEAEANANKKSSIELLEAMGRASKELSNEHMSTIQRAKETIAKTEPLYEQELLRSKCFTNQIERKIDGLEFSIEYCNIDENLEQFRSVK